MGRDFCKCVQFHFCGFGLNRSILHLISQGVKGRSFSSIKASRGGSVAKVIWGGVRLDDDVSTVVSSSSGLLSEA